MNKQTNIIIIISIVLCTFFITKSCSNTNIPINNKDSSELIYEHNQLKDKYTQDSIATYNRIKYLNHQLSKSNYLLDQMVTSKDSIYKIYINTYQKYLSSLDDTETMPIVITTCNELVVIQDSIIIEQLIVINTKDTIIDEQIDLLDIQSITIVDMSTLLNTSNTSLEQSSVDIQKLEKKLVRTRRLGIGGLFIGFIAGIIIK